MKNVPCLTTLSFIYHGALSAFCADTFVAVYFGSQSTIALAQPSTPDAMVPFASFAFWPGMDIPYLLKEVPPA